MEHSFPGFEPHKLSAGVPAPKLAVGGSIRPMPGGGKSGETLKTTPILSARRGFALLRDSARARCVSI
jgi:hypothetical protein